MVGLGEKYIGTAKINENTSTTTSNVIDDWRIYGGYFQNNFWGKPLKIFYDLSALQNFMEAMKNTHTKINKNPNSLTKKPMSILNKFKMLLKSEPEKTFLKAGITYEDGTLTDEGRVVFLAFLLQKYGEAFKTEVVDKMLEEEKNDKK